jgi:hypothetical protein
MARLDQAISLHIVLMLMARSSRAMTNFDGHDAFQPPGHDRRENLPVIPADALSAARSVDHPPGGTYFTTAYPGQDAPRRNTCSHPSPARFSRTPTIAR